MDAIESTGHYFPKLTREIEDDNKKRMQIFLDYAEMNCGAVSFVLVSVVEFLYDKIGDKQR